MEQATFDIAKVLQTDIEKLTSIIASNYAIDPTTPDALTPSDISSIMADLAKDMPALGDSLQETIRTKCTEFFTTIQTTLTAAKATRVTEFAEL